MTTMVAGTSRTRLAVGALMLVSAAIHLSRALVDPEIATLFALNAAGYVVLAALLVLPIPALTRWAGAIRYAVIAYAGITVLFFFLWGAMSGDWPVIGFVDKAVEIALIVLLLRERA
jgi:hypothetical protein